MNFGFNHTLFYNLVMNIMTMLSLTALMISAQKEGLIELATAPFDLIRSKRLVLLAWYFFAMILSAFTLDTTLAFIIMPLCIAYANNRGINVAEMMVAVSFGNVAGSDWTYFGGGDTVVGWTFLQQYLNTTNLSILTWGKLFWVPTFIGCMVTGVWIWFRVFSKGILDEKRVSKIKLSRKGIVQIFLVVGGICVAFLPKHQWCIFIFALVSTFISRLSTEELKRMPWKAIYIWTGAIIIGNIISTFINYYYHFTIPAFAYTIGGITLMLIIVGIMTSFITNSGLAAILLPLVLISPFVDKLWLFVLVTKAISMSYTTIFANACLAVSVGYGMDQRDLLKKGIPIVVLQIMVSSIYFYVMRGHISI